tara:strand:- start:21256 stop:21624 length:369 start_codon:yes stop_codon:yes gene_type:complete
MSKIKEVLNSQLRNKKKLPLQAKEHERRKHNRLKVEAEIKNWHREQKVIKDHYESQRLAKKQNKADAAEDERRFKMWKEAGNKNHLEYGSYIVGDAPWAKGNWTPPSYTERRIAKIKKAKKR